VETEESGRDGTVLKSLRKERKRLPTKWKSKSTALQKASARPLEVLKAGISSKGGRKRERFQPGKKATARGRKGGGRRKPSFFSKTPRINLTSMSGGGGNLYGRKE